jgi:hypothetical protein
MVVLFFTSMCLGTLEKKGVWQPFSCMETLKTENGGEKKKKKEEEDEKEKKNKRRFSRGFKLPYIS